MSGLQRFTRHPDRMNDPHERAHRLASDALLEPLERSTPPGSRTTSRPASRAPRRSTASPRTPRSCARCAMHLPPVPRDLGARVSLALDDGGPPRRGGAGDRAARQPRSPWPALGRPGVAFAGLAAVALVAAPRGCRWPPGRRPALPARHRRQPAAGSDADHVDTQPVAWVRRATDGTLRHLQRRSGPGLRRADATSCGTLDGGARTVAALDVKPSSLLLPRDGNPAVVVGGDAVYAVSVDLRAPVTTPGPEPSSVPTTEPAQSPAVPGESATPPADSPAPSDPPASPDPATPSTDPGAATPLPTILPATPAPSAAPAVAIVEGVVIVGTSPAYSADGQWVAFSARPADGSQGPDIYAWRVGEPQAGPSPATTARSSRAGSTARSSPARPA